MAQTVIVQTLSDSLRELADLVDRLPALHGARQTHYASKGFIEIRTIVFKHVGQSTLRIYLSGTGLEILN